MEKLQHIDRRVIYLISWLLVALALAKPLGLPVAVSPDTRTVFNAVDKLPAGSVVWLGVEFSGASVAELTPGLRAFVHHVFKKNLRLVVSSMWTQGGQIADPIVDEIAKQYGKSYGTDWINIGYKPGTTAYLRLATSDLNQAAAGTDHRGNKLADTALGAEIKALDKPYVSFIMVFETGTPGAKEYLSIVSAEKGIPMSAMFLQMSVPEAKPFVASGQYTGMIGGSRGAAEYEILVGKPGKAAQSTDVQSMVALYFSLLVILGNLGYRASLRKA